VQRNLTVFFALFATTSRFSSPGLSRPWPTLWSERLARRSASSPPNAGHP